MLTIVNIINGLEIDKDKITDEILDHKAKVEYEIKDENYTAYVTSPEGLNIRGGASTGEAVVGFMGFRDELTITGDVFKDGADTGWKRVNYNGVTGFANAAFLSTTRPDVPQPQPQPTPDPQPEYIGYQYAGQDPWGGQLSVTLRQVANGNIDWTFTDVLPNGEMIYKEMSTPYTNGYTDWSITGTLDNGARYDYSGNFKLQGGYVEFTYTNGQYTEGNPDIGEAAAYQVGPLMENGTNTVALNK